MRIKLEKLVLQNFKGAKNESYDFGNITEAYGANATGKTTIFDATMWLLFDKDSSGSSKFQARPLDAEGKQIDNVEISIEGLFDIDGKQMTLKKVQKQKWVKKRDSEMAELQGNINKYEINGYPKSEKEYKEYISSLINESIFKLVTNPQAFPSLPWKEQREVLMKLSTDSSDLEMAQSKKGFANLVPELEIATTEDIQKKYQNALSTWKDKQKEFPARIDEQSRQIGEVDLAELELQKSGINEQIAEKEQQLSDSDKQYDVYQKKSDEILQLKIKLSDIERDESEKLRTSKRDIQLRMDAASDGFENSRSDVRKYEDSISKRNVLLASNRELMKKRQEQYREVSAEEFNKDTAICPTCNRKLEEDKILGLMEQFEDKRKQRLKDITVEGNELKKSIETMESEIKDFEKKIEEAKESAVKFNTVRNKANEELSNLPDKTDFSTNEEYAALNKTTAEMEQELLSLANATTHRAQIKIKASESRTELLEIEKKIASADTTKIEERIEELQTEQREVAQKVADQEKLLCLLEDFVRYKMNMISKNINDKFRVVTWKLFENMMNGSMKETCECVVNGVPYKDLNNGHRIIAGLDIIRTISELYGVSAPIFVDNAEAISEGNLPQMDCQMILLSVSDDKELRMEVQ